MIHDFSYLRNREDDLLKELTFSTSRSSGPGGQNVNKVETKVELRFSIMLSKVLSDVEKRTVLQKLKNRINSNGELVVTAQTSRSQLQNKQIAIQRLLTLLNDTLKPKKKRIATKPTKASVKRRLESKRKHSEKKSFRKKNFL